MNGKFIISLDFELHWGAVEKWDIQKKKAYFIKTKKFIPDLLAIFEENQMRCTWATVGFLFAKNKKQLVGFSPNLTPTYERKELSGYKIFSELGKNENDDPFHFAPSLIRQIMDTRGQELATHTFSHYYCNEKDQTLAQFDNDLAAAQAIAQHNFGVTLESLVFPRNQFNTAYMEVAKKHGIKVIRSNPDIWFWNRNYGKLTPIFRALDTLMPISKSVCFGQVEQEDGLLHLPASRFFRPYKKGEEMIQKFKLNRIKKEMTYAAEQKRNYHLWWHPHNFSEDVKNNKKQLLEIIQHFKKLEKKYNFTSSNMIDFLDE